MDKDKIIELIKSYKDKAEAKTKRGVSEKSRAWNNGKVAVCRDILIDIIFDMPDVNN